jgi:ATP-dependent Clp protease ATP-binding subunit ClpA
MLRQLLDKGMTSNSSFTRSIIVLEANVGSLHMFRLLSEAPSRAALSAETAQRLLKDVLYNKWLQDGCEEQVDTQKTLSLVDLYVPFLPLERDHVRAVLEAHLLERRRRGVRELEFANLTWSKDVLDFLVERVEFEGDYAIEGAKEAPVVLSRHVSRALRRRLHVFDGGESSERKTQVLKLRTRGGAIVAE